MRSATLLRMGGLLSGTQRSSAGGPTSTQILLARSRSGATPFEHGNRQLQLCKRCDELGKDASLGYLRARRRLQNARSSVVNPT
jgi:hypothetical protein